MFRMTPLTVQNIDVCVYLQKHTHIHTHGRPQREGKLDDRFRPCQISGPYESRLIFLHIMLADIKVATQQNYQRHLQLRRLRHTKLWSGRPQFEPRFICFYIALKCFSDLSVFNKICMFFQFPNRLLSFQEPTFL